jgi:hypothetical protein
VHHGSLALISTDGAKYGKMGRPRGLFLSSGSFAIELNSIAVKLLANLMASSYVLGL